MLLRLCTLAVALVCLRTAVAQPTVTLPVWTLQSLGQVTVETSVIRLSDVVKPNGIPQPQWERLGPMVVALVPPDGRRISLQRQRIAEAFARRIVTPASVQWSGSEIISVEYRPASPPNPAAPQRQAFKVAAPAVVAASHVTPTSAAQTEPSGVADRLLQVVVARRSLRRGDIVSPSDLQREALDRPGSTEGLFTDINDIVGQEVKTSLYKGRQIRSEDIGPPTLIRRGDLLELSVIGGGIVVRTGAKAMQEGSDGQLIQVETQEPRRRLLARVVGPGAVEILTRPPQVVAE